MSFHLLLEKNKNKTSNNPFLNLIFAIAYDELPRERYRNRKMSKHHLWLPPESPDSNPGRPIEVRPRRRRKNSYDKKGVFFSASPKSSLGNQSSRIWVHEKKKRNRGKEERIRPLFPYFNVCISGRSFFFAQPFLRGYDFCTNSLNRMVVRCFSWVLDFFPVPLQNWRQFPRGIVLVVVLFIFGRFRWAIIRLKYIRFGVIFNGLREGEDVHSEKLVSLWLKKLSKKKKKTVGRVKRQ